MPNLKNRKLVVIAAVICAVLLVVLTVSHASYQRRTHWEHATFVRITQPYSFSPFEAQYVDSQNQSWSLLFRPTRMVAVEGSAEYNVYSIEVFQSDCRCPMGQWLVADVDADGPESGAAVGIVFDSPTTGTMKLDPKLPDIVIRSKSNLDQ